MSGASCGRKRSTLRAQIPVRIRPARYTEQPRRDGSSTSSPCPMKRYASVGSTTRTSSTSPVSNSPNRATATALTDGLYPRNRAIFSAACSAVPSRIVDASLTFPIKNDISAMDEIIL
jgi:hypothetical protein